MNRSNRLTAPSLRTVQDQLKQLTDHGYLATVPIRSAWPLHPHVYTAAQRGLRLVADAYETSPGESWPGGGGEQRRRARPYGLQHISHELGVTSFDVALLRHADHRADLTLAAVERRYHETGRRFATFLQPDAGYYLVHQRRGKRYFEWLLLEYDRGTMRPAALRDKVRRYERWGRSADGEQYLAALHHRYGDMGTVRPSFRLLFVAEARPGEGSDKDRLATIRTIAGELRREMRQRIWLTTTEALRTAKYDLAVPLWRRVAQTRPLALFPPL